MVILKQSGVCRVYCSICSQSRSESLADLYFSVLTFFDESNYFWSITKMEAAFPSADKYARCKVFK